MVNVKIQLLLLALTTLIMPQVYGVAKDVKYSEFTSEMQQYNVIGHAKRILEELEHIVHAGKMIDEIKSLSEMLTSDTKKKLDILYDNFIKTLDQLKVEAKNSNKDVSECLLGDEDRLYNLNSQFLDDTEECIMDKVEQAEDIRKDTVEKVKTSFKDIMESFNDIDGCGKGLSKVFCIPSVVGKIFLEIAKLPTNIAGFIGEATKTLQVLKKNIEVCAAMKVSEMDIEGTQLISNINRCLRTE